MRRSAIAIATLDESMASGFLIVANHRSHEFPQEQREQLLSDCSLRFTNDKVRLRQLSLLPKAKHD